MFLKKVIKEEHSPMLDGVAARDLVLWKCSISTHDELKETSKRIRFDATNAHRHHLPPASFLSKHVRTVLSPEVYLRLVNVHPVSPIQLWMYECCLQKMRPPPVSLTDLLKERQRSAPNLPRTPPSALGFP